LTEKSIAEDNMNNICRYYDGTFSSFSLVAHHLIRITLVCCSAIQFSYFSKESAISYDEC
jgi:hypothetical protein